MGIKNSGIFEKKISVVRLFKLIGLAMIMIYALILVTFSSLSATYTNIMKVVYIVMLGCAVAYSILNRRKLNINPIILLLFGYVFLSLCSCVWAENKQIALDETYRIFVLATLSLAIYLLVDTEKDFRFVIHCLLAGGLFMIAYACVFLGVSSIIQSISEGGRTGMFQFNLFSLMLNVTNSILLFKILFEKKYLYVIPFLVSLLLLFGTGSRGGYVTLCVQILVYFVIKAKHRGLKFIIPSVAILVVLVAFVIPQFVDMTEYYDRMFTIGDFVAEDSETLGKAEDADGSLVKRKQFIEFGNQLVEKRPIFGYGHGHFEYYYSIRYGMNRPPHTTYLQIAVSTGIVGIVLYYSIYAVSGYAFLKKSMTGFSVKGSEKSSLMRLISERGSKKKHTPDEDTDSEIIAPIEKSSDYGGYAPLMLAFVSLLLSANMSISLLTNKYIFFLFGLFASYYSLMKEKDRGQVGKTNGFIEK